jgi:hypothetical protein
MQMNILKHILGATLAMLIAADSAHAQSVAYSPGIKYDRASWSAFVAAVKPAGAPHPPGTLTFETWATDADTFDELATGSDDVATHHERRFQSSLLGVAHLPANLAARLEVEGVPAPCVAPGNPASGNFPTPAVKSPPANCVAEEVRRNRASYLHIVRNGLNTIAGLQKAFAGPPITFPVDAVELKADWVSVPTLIARLSDNGVHVSPRFVAQNYFITQQDGTAYALTSMHISTKGLPDWLWATFEHRLNPGRCDTMGCYDDYGVLPPLTRIPPGTPNKQYPACVKSPQLAAMFKSAGLADVWDNYCLKATQIDFVSTQPASRGQPVLNGDSVIERITANVPISQSSCITCHAYATFNKDGRVCSNNTGLGSPAPIGAVTPQI